MRAPAARNTGGSCDLDDVIVSPPRQGRSGAMKGSRRRLPWPARSVIAGTTGTAALSLAYAAERRLRPHHPGPLDYDDSLVPGQIVASIMHLPHVTAREENELGLALRWGYGSAFGLWHGVVRDRFRVAWAGRAFGAPSMIATQSSC